MESLPKRNDEGGGGPWCVAAPGAHPGIFKVGGFW